MSDPTTTNIVLAVPTHLSDSGTWDTPLNGDFTILDACYGSVTSKSLSSSNVTLTATESQVSILRFSGTLTSNVTITLGAIIKSWICENSCLGAFTITVTGSTGTGNVVALPPGSSQLYWDGTNVKFINLGKIGQYWDHAVSAVPAWITACSVPPALIADGTTFNATTYALLNLVLGGNTLPDARGRSRFSLNGGTNRVTTAGSSIDGDTKFASGGRQDAVLLQSDLRDVGLTVVITDPGHPHSVNRTQAGVFQAGSNAQAVTDVSAAGSASGSAALLHTTGITATTASINGGVSQTAVKIMPPTYIGGITMIWAV